MSTCRAAQIGEQKPVPVIIEGYKVYMENEEDPGTNMIVKEEPVDPEYERTTQTKGHNPKETSRYLPITENSHNVNVPCKQMLDSKSEKPKPFKSQTSTVKPQVNVIRSQIGTVFLSQDPTSTCQSKGVTLSNGALVEVFATSDTDMGLEQVCAVSSKVFLTVNWNKHLRTEITYYWCNFCCFKSDEKGSFLEHVLVHRFHCNFCSYHSFSRATVIQHSVEKHPQTSSNLKYCRYLPDTLDSQRVKKRKAIASLSNETIPSKRSFHESSDDCIAQPVITNVMSGLEAVSTAMTNVINDKKAVSVDKTNVISGNKAVSAAMTKVISDGQTVSAVKKNIISDDNTVSAAKTNIVIDDHTVSTAKTNISDDQTVSAAKTNIVSDDHAVSTAKTTIISDDRTVLAVKTNVTQGLEKIENTNHQHICDKSCIFSKRNSTSFSFKCGHCFYTAPVMETVKLHLFEHHRGVVIYAIDMRVTRQRYVFFCMNQSCSFETKNKSAFLEHSKFCTPWSTGSHSDVDSLLINSLKRTQQFVQAGLKNELARHKKISAKYSCVYCPYVSRSNTIMKKHVMSWHMNQSCAFRDLGDVSMLYFCKHCLFETRKEVELETHLTRKHQMPTSEATVSTATASNTESTRTTQAKHTSTDNQAKPTATDDTETAMETNEGCKYQFDQLSSSEYSDLDEEKSELDKEKKELDEEKSGLDVEILDSPQEREMSQNIHVFQGIDGTTLPVLSEEYTGVTSPDKGVYSLQTEKKQKMSSFEEIQDFLTENAARNTTRKTESDMNIFYRWVTENLPGEKRQMEDIPPSELNQILGTFYVKIRKQDGEEYEPDSIKAMQNSFDRYLSQKDYNVSLLKGHDFKGSRVVLSAKRKQLKHQGYGRKPNRTQALSEEEEEVLWNSGQLGMDNARSLQNAIWLRNSFFGMRGRREHKDMKWGDVSIQTDINGRQYLEYHKRDTKMGKDPHQARVLTTRIYAIPETPERCPVNLMIQFTHKRPKAMLDPESPFYLSILNDKQMKQHTWYKSCALGEHSLGDLMKNMCTNAGLSTRLTNHSGRITTVKHL